MLGERNEEGSGLITTGMEVMSAVEPNQANFSPGSSVCQKEHSFADVNAIITTSARVWDPPVS